MSTVIQSGFPMTRDKPFHWRPRAPASRRGRPCREDGGRCAERHADAGAALEASVLGAAADVLTADERRRDRLRARDIDVLTAPDAPAAIHRREPPGRARDRSIKGRGERAVLERRLAGAAAIATARAGKMKRVQIGAEPFRVRPVCPNGVIEIMTRFGVAAASVAYRGPSRRARRACILDDDVDPGGETAREVTATRVVTSRVMPRLLVLRRRRTGLLWMRDVVRNGPQVREGSPLGGSTFSTSAP